MEVAIVALGVEVGNSRGELDSREDAATGAIETACYCAGLLSSIGKGLDGWRRVVGDRGGPATEQRRKHVS